MPSITVPKPVTSPSPVTVTHSPYDPTGMMYPKANIPQGWASGPGPAQPVGTITGSFPNPFSKAPAATTAPQIPQKPSWWDARVGNLPGKTAPADFVPGTRTDLTWLLQQASRPDPRTLFENWFKGPQGPAYKAAMSLPYAQAQQYAKAGIPDQLKWDITQAYGSDPAIGATRPGSPLGVGGLYGTPIPPATSGQVLTPEQGAKAVSAMSASPLTSISSVGPGGTVYGSAGTNPQTMEYNPQTGYAAVGPVSYYNPSANLPGYDPNARITPGWKPQPKK